MYKHMYILRNSTNTNTPHLTIFFLCAASAGFQLLLAAYRPNKSSGVWRIRSYRPRVSHSFIDTKCRALDECLNRSVATQTLSSLSCSTNIIQHERETERASHAKMPINIERVISIFYEYFPFLFACLTMLRAFGCRPKRALNRGARKSMFPYFVAFLLSLSRSFLIKIGHNRT